MSLDARLTATADGLLRSFEPRAEAAYAGTLVRARRRQQRNFSLAAGFGVAAALALSLFGTRISELVLGFEPPPLPPTREDTNETTNLDRELAPRLEEELSVALGARSANVPSGHDFLPGGPSGIGPRSGVGSSSISTHVKSVHEPRVVEFPYTENEDGVPGWEYDGKARPGERWIEIWIEDDSGEPLFFAVDVYSPGSNRSEIYDACRYSPPHAIPKGSHLQVGPWVRRSSDGGAPHGFFNPMAESCPALPTSGTLFIAFYKSQPQ